MKNPFSSHTGACAFASILTLAAINATAATAPEPPKDSAKLDELETCAAQANDRHRLDCYQKLIDQMRAARDEMRAKEPAPFSAEAKSIPPPTTAQITDEISKVVEDHFDPSYFTLRAGKRFGNDQTNSRMLYEAQIFHNLTFNNKFERVGPLRLRLDVPVRLGLRQLTEDSYPVRTPSYNPGLRLFIVPDFGNDATPEFKPSEKLTYYSFGAYHYSNGQEGSSLATRETPGTPSPTAGRANQRNGNFNTNYLELAGHHYRKGNTIEWARLAVRRHFDSTWDDIQQDQYPRYQYLAEARTRDFAVSDHFALQLRAATSYGAGYQYVFKNPTPFPNSIDARSRDKLNSTFEFLFKIPNKTDLALYLRYDHGFDYYNINFQNKINRVQFGVVTK
jgi:hypothetical protein